MIGSGSYFLLEAEGLDGSNTENIANLITVS